MNRFALRRNDARTVYTQTVVLLDQAEFDGVPVQARQVGQRVDADGVRFHAPAAVCLYVVGEHRIEQQRHVAEQIMEQVWFADVVDLVRTADPPRHRKTGVGEVIEEGQLRQ